MKSLSLIILVLLITIFLGMTFKGGNISNIEQGAQTGAAEEVTGNIDIGELLIDPAKYEGVEVLLAGEVLSDPVYIGEKTYIEMQDATGRIFVEIEGFMGPPLVENGDTIKVTGAVRIDPSYGGPHGGEHSDLPSYIIEATEVVQVS
jgi:hypothetical protein